MTCRCCVDAVDGGVDGRVVEEDVVARRIAGLVMRRRVWRRGVRVVRRELRDMVARREKGGEGMRRADITPEITSIALTYTRPPG